MRQSISSGAGCCTDAGFAPDQSAPSQYNPQFIETALWDTVVFLVLLIIVIGTPMTIGYCKNVSKSKGGRC